METTYAPASILDNAPSLYLLGVEYRTEQRKDRRIQVPYEEGRRIGNWAKISGIKK